MAGLLLATLPILGVVRSVQAQVDGPSEYSKLIEEAVREFREGNWPEARAQFQAAHEVEPSARTLRGIGLSAFEERSYGAAVLALRAALADERKPLTSRQREQVTSILQRAGRYVANYTLDLSPGDAVLQVDGREPTLLEGVLLLDPGVHEIHVSAEGYRSHSRRLRARANDQGRLLVVLKPAAEELPPVAQGGEVEEQSAFAAKEEGSWMTPRRWVGVGVGGLGVASLSTSLALTLTAMSKRDEAGCRSTTTGVVCESEDDQALRTRARVLARAATGTVVVGGVALAAGAVLLLWPERERRAGEPPLRATLRAAHIAPVVSPGQAGITWGGEF